MSRTVLGIDVGGTFTDLCLWDGRAVRIAKTPSTPDNFVRGICTGLDLLGITPARRPPVDDDAQHGGTRSDGTSALIDLVHGSTVATNSLLERKGDRVAFVTTAGFEDLLTIGRQDRPELYALHVCRRPGLVSRGDCFGVVERIGADGEIVTPLDLHNVDKALGEIRERGIGAVAICLLFGYLNPIHEREIAARAEALGLRAYASSDILPEFREFERASTTVANAYVATKMAQYLSRLDIAARQRGIASVRVMQSNGGQIGVAAASRHAVRTILSGPAGGVVAAARVGRELGLSRLITYDMGGTSTDVALIDGDIAIRHDTIVEGIPIGVPMLAIHTIGAGGGSVASIDDAGGLRVGPESAGAEPGPACYGRSDLSTVTDAHVVLGRIRPQDFMGGQISIDPARSTAALSCLGVQMRCDAVAAARAVATVCSANMEHAISVVSAQQGYDPADFWLVSFGGAGGLHACDLALALGLAGVIVPASAGVLSAYGLMMSDIVMDFAESLPRGATGIDLSAIRYIVGRLMDRAAEAICREGYDLDDSDVERLIDLRYAGQAYELTVPLESLTDAARVAAAFHARHWTQYGFASQDRPVEAVTARVRASIQTQVGANAEASNRTAQGRRARTAVRRAPTPKPIGKSLVWFDAMHAPVAGKRRTRSGQKRSARTGTDAARMTPFFARASLVAGQRIVGPALIVEDHATTVLPPGWSARVVGSGHIQCTRV